MRDQNQFQALSEAIVEPITKAYREGGFGLAFLLLGALMIFTAAVFPVGSFSYPLAAIGFILVLLTGYFFYAKDIRPISRAQKAVDRSSEMINAVQSTAIEITDLVLSVQALAFKHKDQIATALGAVQPQIRAVPGLDNVAGGQLLSQADDLAKNIVFRTAMVKEVVEKLQEALTHSDAEQLRVYLRDVKRIRAQVDTLLALPTPKAES